MSGERALIVEDEVAMSARPLKVLLVGAGYTVVGIARATDEAVSMTKTHRPDVVLMDVKLPPARGVKAKEDEGIRTVQQIVAVHDPTIVFVTSMPATDELMQAVATASRDAIFVQKPYTDGQMLACVKLATLRRHPSKRVFVCYSHQDADLEREMQEFLGPMARQGMTFWDDTRLEPGERWQERIMQEIARADAAVLLVSTPFIGSRFITEFELPALLKAQQDRGLEVILVHLGPVVPLLLGELAGFQGVNAPDKPMRGWKRLRRQRDGWVPLCERLLNVLKHRTA
jgi:DNA-binding response OmpR family regulator